MKSSMPQRLMVHLSWGRKSSPESCNRWHRQEAQSPIRNWTRATMICHDADLRRKVILASFPKRSDSAAASSSDFKEPLGVLGRSLSDLFQRQFGMDRGKLLG